MQKHYEHSLPKVKTCESKRKVLVFRNGTVKSCKDNGKQTSCEATPSRDRIWYGEPKAETGIEKYLSLFTRAELVEHNVHK